MEALIKKLEEIKKAAELMIPSIKPPAPPAPPSVESIKSPEAPKAGTPSSKKDPTKVAQQLKNPHEKNQAIDQAKKLKEGIKFSKSGQWELTKAKFEEKSPS